MRVHSDRSRKTFRWVVRWAIRAVFLVIAFGLLAGFLFSFRCRSTELKFLPATYAEQHPQEASGIANYSRPEQDTFYTYPEWYIVWSYQAKADFQRTQLPSRYTYFSDIAQYWRNYCCAFAAARNRYPASLPDHVMLVVIGTSFSVEYAVKAAYEHSLGRVSEWTSANQMTSEDLYAAKVAQDYARFVHIRPFYEYSFAHALRGLWAEVPLRGSHWLRKAERRAWLTLDYGVEAFYCGLIELATHATYGYEDTETSAWIAAPSPKVASGLQHVRVIKELGNGNYIVEFPRYQEFTDRSLEAVHSGIRFLQLAGNHNILISVVSDHPFVLPSGAAQVRSDVIPSEPRNSRTALLCQVPELAVVLLALEQQHVTIEHVYDY